MTLPIFASRLRVAILLATCVFAASCAGGETAPRAMEPSRVGAQPAHGPGPMRDVRATQMGPRLAAVGLDAKNLPPLESLDRRQKLAVMKTFSDSLGLACVDCHDADEFAADTPRRRVAKRMFNEIVRVVAFEDDAPVYCDSCHQGALYTLDRGDKSKVSAFMSDVLVGKLKRSDGNDHGCETCHGDPPEFAFLATWRARPAPNAPPQLAPSKPEPPPTVTSAPAPAMTAPPPGPPKPAVAQRPRTPAAACGDKSNLCPLQKWMRENVATAVAAKDAASLARALDRIATFAPEPSWTSWVEMSKVAADAARRGDFAEARKSCQGCHNAYKAKWVAAHRGRAIRR